MFSSYTQFRHSTTDLQKVLDELGIIPLPKPIMEMTLKEIRTHFGYATTKGIKKTLLMRNLIWQLYTQIQAGQPPDFYKKQGFIRGMWYFIKKKFSTHHPLRGDMYNLMSSELTLMVRKGLFSYADFNFRDRDADSWKLGFDNPHIILASEKDGFITIMEDLHRRYGCDTITCGGVPSFMTINYMVESMQRYEIDMEQTFHIITFCDFDPSGYNVSESLVEHFHDSGLKNVHYFNQWGEKSKSRPWLELAVPENFPDNLKNFRYRLPKSTWDNPTTVDWIKLTGGINADKWKKGKPTYGLESDEFDFDLILQLFDDALQPLLTSPSDGVIQRNALQELRQEIEQMAIVKFLQRLQGKNLVK
jgi:hypothetical protein